MRCPESFCSTSFQWLIFFFAAVLRGSIIHKCTRYKKMNVTRMSISCTLELREMFLLFQTGSNLVSATIVCAILESISGLEPLSDTTEHKYLKLVTVSSFCLFTLISLLMPLGLNSSVLENQETHNLLSSLSHFTEKKAVPDTWLHHRNSVCPR